MRLLAFDGRMGASGDMILGALLAAGADRGALDPVESALGVRYDVSRTTKNGIAATSVDVLLGDGDGGGAARGGDQGGDGGGHDHDRGGRGHGHHHGDADHGHGNDHGEGGHSHGQGGGDHGHHHGHENGDGHGHGHDHAEGAGPTRAYREVVGIVESMDLPPGAEADALATFELLGEAEAAVHGVDLDGTAFHEVGADDAIADVVGAALLIDDLSPDRVVTTPVAAGGGEVEMSHGRYPVPPPAVVEIAERAGWELRGGPVESELLTPTGAAILAHFAEGVDALPSLSVSASGYGAGGREFPEHPNVLRALVGDGEGGLVRDEIAVLETNLDDASPEFLGGLHEALADAGARDVTAIPTTMKKSRPGHLVKVVVKPEDAERVARRLAEETGTLGIRESGTSHRLIAERRFVTATLAVEGERREVAVKVASTAGGEAYDVSAEYDDAAAVAREADIPARDVARRAEAAARDGGALAPRLVHVVEAGRWEGVEGAYAPASLGAEGFVHLSPPGRAPGVAQYNYPDAEEPLLVVVDRGAVEPHLKYEETPTGAFPHLYGELDTDAVVEVLPFPREDGRYVLPEGLEEG